MGMVQLWANDWIRTRCWTAAAHCDCGVVLLLVEDKETVESTTKGIALTVSLKNQTHE